MPISFDLSALEERFPVPPSTPTPPGGLDLTKCAPVDEEDGFRFSLTSRSLVRRLARPVLTTLGVASQEEDSKCDRADSDAHDQYSVKNGRSLIWAVLFHNDTGYRHPRSLLGDFGHAERLPAWLHLVGGLGFLIYAALRPVYVTESHTIAESLTTTAAFGISFCFLSSTIYHITAPSRTLSYWTRQLDFLGIYTALALGALADFAIATRGFSNVSWLSIVDIPIACVCVGIFFFSRRAMTPSSETWSSFLGHCTVNFGLFRRFHMDETHTGARQATSFVLAIAYFVSVPAVFNNFGTSNGLTLLALELGALLVLCAGMGLDNGIVWPDLQLSRGNGPSFLSCKRGGCVGSAHALWHILTVLAACKGAVGRELALTWQR